MKIKEGLLYDSIHDEVEGYEDYFGALRMTKKIADYALLYMLAGFGYRWKQPFANYPSAGEINGIILEKFTKEEDQEDPGN